MKLTLLALGALLFASSALAQEAIFSAGGTFETPKGYVGMPVATWNPPSNPAHPSGMPFTVPDGKILLVTDIYLETDPLPPYPFLMVLAAEINGTANTLRTIQLREPVASYVSLETPLPLEAGTTLHALFQNSMPATQSVNWAITGRLVDTMPILRSDSQPGQKPAMAKPYPFPPVYLRTTPAPITIGAISGLHPEQLIAPAGTAEFIADAVTGSMARIIERNGDTLTLDRSADFLGGTEAIPVWVADYGTDGTLIRDVEAPPCDEVDAVLLLGPFVGRFEVTSCQDGLLRIDTVAAIKPGQKLQYIKDQELPLTNDTQ